jgi:uncharacterized protein (DUF305 family)
VPNRIQSACIVVVIAAFGASCRSAGTAVPRQQPPPAAAPQSAAPPAAPPIVQPGAPGQPSQVISAEKATDLSQVEYTGADIKFMQGMIGHHAQALEMVELLKTRTQSDDMKKLALRIELSQDDEIKMMQTWLAVRRQRVPARTEMHQHGAQLMPGMLTQDEMKQLEAAKGAEFDRLFLEGMIKHHGGALAMVRELLDTPGAAQESDVFAFVSDVEADQRMEIDRMGSMLASLAK